MERYESLGLVGEGSYGTVLKCRHRESGRLVAIKKFVDSDDDRTVKKIALREIKLLKQLRHDNLVNLMEVWRRRRRWYLVFEFVERTLLDDLEKTPNGLELDTSRLYLYQILRAAAFCHQQHIIHRDIKPENVLISHRGVVKLCDFGFARVMTSPADGGFYTDYVATRWYRAPELLVGDTKYGKPVDVWAVGCLLMEMLTGQPLFPGDSDLDQIHHIIRCFGNLTARHQELFYRNPIFSGVRLPECSGRVMLERRFPTVPAAALDLAQRCLQMDPERRAQCCELLEDPLFTQDSFHIRVLDELNAKIQKDHRENSTLPKIKDMDGKLAKEKEKRDEEGEIVKTPKPKCKKPSNQPKIKWKIAEKPVSTTRGKPGKATEAQQRKMSDASKQVKTVPSHTLEEAKARHGKRRSKTTDTTDLTGLICSHPDSGVMEMWRTKSHQSWNESNTKVSRCSKSSTSDHPRRNPLSTSESRGTSPSGPGHIQEPKRSEAEADVKSKSLVGEAQTKLASFSKCTKSTVTDLFPANFTVFSDQQASSRNFRFHSTDAADMESDFSFSPPPPPSSTPLTPSCSAAPPNNLTNSDGLTLGRGFQPGVRCAAKLKHGGGDHTRLAQQPLTGHLTGSQKTETECCDATSITVSKKKSDVRFPDLLPALGGSAGEFLDQEATPLFPPPLYS